MFFNYFKEVLINVREIREREREREKRELFLNVDWQKKRGIYI